MSWVVQESREPGHVPIAALEIASVLEYGENAARNYFIVRRVYTGPYAGSCADRCRGHTPGREPITVSEVDAGPAEENGRPSPLPLRPLRMVAGHEGRFMEVRG